MLMTLGPVVFDMVSNLTETDSSIDSAFAKHDVIGADPIYEAVGGDGGEVTLVGVIHPEFTGVNGTLAALEAAQAEQMPLPLMRGDYVPLGWFVIRNLKRTDTSLNESGVGREITFNVSLIRTAGPSAGFSVAGLAESILGLF